MENKELRFAIIADYYTKHRDELLCFVDGMLLHADGGEDIVQDVFLRLLRSDKMITPVTLPGLALTVARRLVFDRWRRIHSAQEYGRQLSAGNDGPHTESLSVYGVSEVYELMERGMARLTEKQRTVYRMHMRDGLRVAEISEALRWKYKSVENQLGAARKEMRQYMLRMLG